MAQIEILVSADEMQFVNAINGRGRAPCEHTTCGGVLRDTLSEAEHRGFVSLSERGLARQTLSHGFLQLDSEFATGLDGLANMRQEKTGPGIGNWKWAFDTVTLKVA